jgi:catechol 2,3-dioxygenase-like lactoylglutathione lyase family enzyme
MSSEPTVRFLSLFVPDLQAAARYYQSIFGAPALDHDDHAPSAHPFAAAGPVVFALGPVRLALYQCDQRTTHPGDVGIGIEVESGMQELCARASQHGGRVFRAPSKLANGGRTMAGFMLPDRHFFEIVDAPPDQVFE